MDQSQTSDREEGSKRVIESKRLLIRAISPQFAIIAGLYVILYAQSNERGFRKMLISGFIDEAASDLDEQLQVARQHGQKFIELRSVWGINVLELSDEQVETIADKIAEHGVQVSSIGSPLGKSKILDPFEPQIEKMQRAVEVAKRFGAGFIRVFSFYLPEGANHEDYREEVIRRMRVLTEIAERNELVLLHENEKHIYGDIPERCLHILQAVNSPSLKAAFDPANFIQCGVKPMPGAFELLQSHVFYIHIKDALLDGGQVVPVGQGDGGCREMLQLLHSQGYNGFLSLEPHLRATGIYEGRDNAYLYGVASDALRSLLEDLGIDAA